MEISFFTYIFGMTIALATARLPFSFPVDFSLLFAGLFSYLGVQEFLNRRFSRRKKTSRNYDELIKFAQETERRKKKL
jgi:hypothetical protein